MSRDELIWINARLPQNRTQRTFRHVAGMVWDCRIAIGPRVEPDLVAPSRLAIKLKSEHFEPAHDFSSGHHDCEILIFRCWRQGEGAFAFPPRLDQTASDVAGNFQCLGHSAALRNQPRQLFRGCQKDAFRQYLHVNLHGDFHELNRSIAYAGTGSSCARSALLHSRNPITHKRKNTKYKPDVSHKCL